MKKPKEKDSFCKVEELLKKAKQMKIKSIGKKEHDKMVDRALNKIKD
jgi:hypothetical protein